MKEEDSEGLSVLYRMYVFPYSQKKNNRNNLIPIIKRQRNDTFMSETNP